MAVVRARDIHVSIWSSPFSPDVWEFPLLCLCFEHVPGQACVPQLYLWFSPSIDTFSTITPPCIPYGAPPNPPTSRQLVCTLSKLVFVPKWTRFVWPAGVENTVSSLGRVGFQTPSALLFPLFSGPPLCSALPCHTRRMGNVFQIVAVSFRDICSELLCFVSVSMLAAVSGDCRAIL